MLAGTAMRLALAMSIGLSVDESYAAVMGRRLSLSYFDHPPMAFWWTGIATRLAASEGPIVVRLPFIAAFVLTTWLMYRLGALLFGESAGLLAAFLLNASLFFSVAAGGWALPDGPLLLFSVASAYCLARASIDGLPAPAGAAPRGGRNAWWVGFGATAGLALLSKYHGFFLLVGAALYLLSSRQRAAWMRRPGPYLAIALATAIFLPVVVWNSAHDWASFRFQGGRSWRRHRGKVLATHGGGCSCAWGPGPSSSSRWWQPWVVAGCLTGRRPGTSFCFRCSGKQWSERANGRGSG